MEDFENIKHALIQGGIGFTANTVGVGYHLASKELGGIPVLSLARWIGMGALLAVLGVLGAGWLTIGIVGGVSLLLMAIESVLVMRKALKEGTEDINPENFKDW